jgi:putative ABC transport system permease protein
MDALRPDVVHAFRSLIRRPAYFVASVATLALVVGANAAIFAVLNATLLRPLPFTAGDRTIALYLNPPGSSDVAHRNPLHAIDLVRFRERTRTMARIEAFSLRDMLLTGHGEPEVVKGGLVTAGLFEMMGTTPQIGRGFTREEDRPRSGAAIITHGLWQRRFGGSPRVIGTRLIVHGEPREIVGVLPPDFPPALLDAEVFTPIGITPGTALEPISGPSTFVVTVAELRDGATVRQAREEVDAMTRELASEFPLTHGGWTGGAWTVREWQFGEMRPALLVLMAATLVVLLIACANLANLTLVQVLGRRSEMALRLALGAGRADLLRLYGIESAIVSGAGALAGLLLARGAVPALLALNPASTNTLGRVSIDWRVQAFTVVLALVTTCLAGIVPALRALRDDAAGSLGGGSRRSTGSRADVRVRAALLVTQTALCLALLVGGGVLLRSFAKSAAVSPGFSADHVLTAQVRLPETAYTTPERRAQAVAAILARLRADPGIVAASTTQNLFQPGFAFVTIYDVENQPTPDGQRFTAQFRRVSPDYFKVMRIRELAGRTFTESDGPAAPQVAVVSRLLAQRHWPGQDPVGRRIRRGSQNFWLTVVGVVDDVSDVGLQQAPEGTIYTAYAQGSVAAAPVAFVARTRGEPLAAVGAVRAAAAAVDPQLPIHRIATLEAFLADSLNPHRFRATVLSLLGALGLVLAAVGIYGITARAVAERTREFGVRVALGSDPGAVVRLVVLQALRAVAIGAAAGVLAGLWLTSLLGRVLADVIEPDVVTGGVAAAVLVGTATISALLPALRVLRIDPVEALRAE